MLRCSYYWWELIVYCVRYKVGRQVYTYVCTCSQPPWLSQWPGYSTLLMCWCVDQCWYWWVSVCWCVDVDECWCRCGEMCVAKHHCCSEWSGGQGRVVNVSWRQRGFLPCTHIIETSIALFWFRKAILIPFRHSWCAASNSIKMIQFKKCSAMITQYTVRSRELRSVEPCDEVSLENTNRE